MHSNNLHACIYMYMYGLLGMLDLVSLIPLEFFEKYSMWLSRLLIIRFFFVLAQLIKFRLDQNGVTRRLELRLKSRLIHILPHTLTTICIIQYALQTYASGFLSISCPTVTEDKVVVHYISRVDRFSIHSLRC